MPAPVVTLGGREVTLCPPRSLLLVVQVLRTEAQREARPGLLWADGLACLADCWPLGVPWPVPGAPVPYGVGRHSAESYGEMIAAYLLPGVLGGAITMAELRDAGLAAYVWAVEQVVPPRAAVEAAVGNSEAPQGASPVGS